ncbi:MAG: primase [Actinomycetota bacterium]|nr:primase [Actinomycetota bacterium]
MAKIRAEDIAEVRERARIDEVVAQTVALKPAGGGSYKGLCPFHDERSPSFQVSAAKGLWYCFGCGEGGDTIDFVMRIDALSFAEAVEKLAGQFGVELHYEEGSSAPGRQQGQRIRLVAANSAAAEYFRARLTTPEAAPGREFLTSRGFDEEAVATFGVGFAPKSWDALTGHLRGRGFRDDELLAAGLVSQGNRGIYDRFRGRLVWPIRDLGGDVVGFGARKIFDDDSGPKYLNTPETPLYSKSRVLYGIDLARQAIAKQQRAVVVEGYTDVMACHLAGVPSAVATCGTAFGEGHVKVLRRLLMDDDAMSGEVIFTFDGDAAGRRAALRAFDTDQAFVAQTYVAVQPDGLDPCDARLTGGDEAVRALVDGRVPLFEFAIRSTLDDHDLNSAEGRVAALRASTPLLGSMRDVALRSEYAQRLAGWLGMDPAAVQAAVRRGGGADRAGNGSSARRGVGQRPIAVAGDFDPRLERQAIQVMLQRPDLVTEWAEVIEDSAFADPACTAVFRAIRAAGEPADAAESTLRLWVAEVLAQAEDDAVRAEVRRWTVLAMPLAPGADPAGYATGVMARLISWDIARRIAPLKGQLARLDPQREPEVFTDIMAQVMDLESYRRELRDMASGEV